MKFLQSCSFHALLEILLQLRFQLSYGSYGLSSDFILVSFWFLNRFHIKNDIIIKSLSLCAIFIYLYYFDYFVLYNLSFIIINCRCRSQNNRLHRNNKLMNKKHKPKIRKRHPNNRVNQKYPKTNKKDYKNKRKRHKKRLPNKLLN